MTTVSVCLSVCLSASTSLELHVRSSPIFVHVTMSVAPFSFDGVEIRYVLPVLWITSCLQIMAKIGDATVTQLGVAWI